MSEREGPQRERGAREPVGAAGTPTGPAEERGLSEREGPQRERGLPPPTQPALVLDCRGQRCPLPVIELARRIGGVDLGELVVLLADDPAARVDVPAWCRMRGQEYAGETAGADGVPGYAVRRRH